MKIFWMALATTGVLAAAGFPARDATTAIGKWRTAAATRTQADASWGDAGALVLLAGGMFGAAIGLKRRTLPRSTRQD